MQAITHLYAYIYIYIYAYLLEYWQNKKNLYVGSFNYFSYTIQIGSNWYMDTGVRTQKLYFLRLILADNLSNRPIYAVLNTYNFDMILQLKHMRIVMNPARIALYDWKS